MEINKLIKSRLNKIVKEQSESHISEQGTYMVLQNLVQMKENIEKILSMKNHPNFPKCVTGEHAWAGDHIATSKDDIEEVSNFISSTCGNENELNEAKNSAQQAAIAINMKKKGKEPKEEVNEEEEIDEAKHKPTNAKLWSRAKSMAKSKFKVYPSAYANGWAAKWYKSHGGGWKTVK